MRARRESYVNDPKLVDKLLTKGIQRMRAEAVQTMALVREAMGLFRPA
jgi:hypothetical protein